MRFGQTLRSSVYAPWKDNYIDYAKLKKLLREDDSSTDIPVDQWTEEDEGNFVDELVNVQLEKVHAFHKDTLEKLRDRTGKCEAKLDNIAVEGVSDKETAAGSNDDSNGKKAVLSDAEKRKTLDEVQTELNNISKEVSELEKYSRINYAGFLKAAKKHDRKRGGSYRVRPLLQVRLAALPFNKEDYSPLLYRLSTMYTFIRQHSQDKNKRESTVPEELKGRSSYTSYKFWVHPDNLLELKTMVLRHLPVLVYNPQTLKVAEGNKPDPSITSVYFDNPAFKLYTKKVDSGDASSLRVRWYGQLNAKPQLFVEKKTVYEDNTSQEARFGTKEKYLQPFISGEYNMDKQVQKLADRAGAESGAVKDLEESVEEIQKFILDNNLQPVLRANYNRTAFQIPGDDRVRISLDSDLVFIREDALDIDRPCRDPATWHRIDIDGQEMEYPFTNIRKGEINRFPFNVLEITVRNQANKHYEWIEDIMNSHLVKEAPRFSKFVHGVAALFEDNVNTFPFWLSEIETDIRRDPQQAFEEEQAKKQRERDDEFAVGSLLKSNPSISPRHRSHSDAIASPISSPKIADRTSPSSAQQGIKKRRSQLGKVTNADDAQLHSTAEEPDEDETGIRSTGPAQEQQSSTASRLADLFPSFSTSKYATAKRAKTQLPPGVSEPTSWIKDQGPVKVEAKVWLANQRTFIKWQHVSILLFTLGVGLFNAAGKHNTIARGLAVVYTCVALFTAAWGYGIYMWRSDLIRKRSGKDFDAMTGPIVVCVGLIVALVLNFAFKYRIVFEEREGSHSNDWNQTLQFMTPAHGGDL